MIPALVLGGLALAAGMACREQAPEAARQIAARELEHARLAGATRKSPLLRPAQDAFDRGSSLMALGAARRARTHFAIAARRAVWAARLTARRRRQARRLAERMIGHARDGQREIEWLAAYLPARDAVRASIKRSQVNIAEAEALLEQGDVRRAVAAAGRAIALLDSADDRIAAFAGVRTDTARHRRYRRWIDETLAWSRSHNARAILVDKMRHSLTLVTAGRRTRTYSVELGINSPRPKILAGDRATPEGKYRITQKRGPRQTRWYKALLLDYPNKTDLARFESARRRGLISERARPGSLIEIHGEGGRGGDWTDGCVALTNADMDHLFDRISVGTPVTIVGFEVTEASRPGKGRTASRHASRRRASAID